MRAVKPSKSLHLSRFWARKYFSGLATFFADLIYFWILELFVDWPAASSSDRAVHFRTFYSLRTFGPGGTFFTEMRFSSKSRLRLSWQERWVANTSRRVSRTIHPDLPAGTPCYNFTGPTWNTVWWAVCTNLRGPFNQRGEAHFTSDSRFKAASHRNPFPIQGLSVVRELPTHTWACGLTFTRKYLAAMRIAPSTLVKGWMQPCTTNILVNAVSVVRFVGLHPIKPHTPPLKTNPVKHLGWDPRWSITRPLTYLSTTDFASRPVTGQTNWVSNPGCSRRLSPRMMQLDPPVPHFRRPRSSVSRTISIQPHVSVLFWRAPFLHVVFKTPTC